MVSSGPSPLSCGPCLIITPRNILIGSVFMQNYCTCPFKAVKVGVGGTGGGRVYVSEQGPFTQSLKLVESKEEMFNTLGRLQMNEHANCSQQEPGVNLLCRSSGDMARCDSKTNNATRGRSSTTAQFLRNTISKPHALLIISPHYIIWLHCGHCGHRAHLFADTKCYATRSV